jgi:dipeptidyl aminopeptidase/acylaminoacyl peptidase
MSYLAMLARRGLGSCFLALLLTAGVLNAQSVEPLSVEDAISTRSFTVITPVDLSPDGRIVAYTLQDPRRLRTAKDERHVRITETGASFLVRGSDIWLSDVVTGKAVNLTNGVGASWAPVWSPDSNYLAFYSDRDGATRVWVWDRRRARLTRASTEIVRVFYGFEVVQWLPDSRRLVAKVLPRGVSIEDVITRVEGPPSEKANPDEKSITARVFSSASDQRFLGGSNGDTSLVNIFAADIAVFDVVSGQVRRLTTAENPFGVWLSPDGEHIAYTHFKRFESGVSIKEIFDLLLVRIPDAIGTTVAKDISASGGSGVSWSPDGNSLAFLADVDNKGERCSVFSMLTRTSRPLTDSSHPSFQTLYRRPVWDRSSTKLYFITDNAIWQVPIGGGIAEELVRLPGKRIIEITGFHSGQPLGPARKDSMVFMTIDSGTKMSGFHEIDLRTRKVAPIFERPYAHSEYPLFTTDVSSDGSSIVFAFENVRESKNLWIASGNLTQPKRITNINVTATERVLGDSRLVEWISVGRKLQGTLLLPAGYSPGRLYPLITIVYGGYFPSNYVNRFGLLEGNGINLQLFATRGYAVLLPDVPMNAVGSPMKDIADAILPAIDKLVTDGIADPNRLGIMGHSYGGYSTLAMIVQTNRFKAAISYAGFGNLYSNYTAMPPDGNALNIAWSEKGQGRMGGTPWEFRERYMDNSPFFFLDRVTTPLLIIHGSKDTIPIHLAEETFVSLRRLGKPVEYVRYENESHSILGYANRIDFQKRVIRWFEEHLKGFVSNIKD